LERSSRVEFTRHALGKFELLRGYGFHIERKDVVDAVLHPERLDERGNQLVASKAMSSTMALRVVYEDRKDYLAVITFYPVRRERYGV